MSKITELKKYILELEMSTENSVNELELESETFELDRHQHQLLAEEKAILDTIFLIKRKISEIYA